MHRVGSAGNTSNSTRPRKEKRLTYVLNDADNTKHCAGVNCLAVLNSTTPGCCGYLFTGSRDGTLKGWALSKNDATYSATFESHVDWVNDAVMAGSNLVSCSSDTTLKIWNPLSDGVCMRTLRQHSDYVICLAAAEKNSNIVASAGLGGEVFIWDIEAALLPVAKFVDPKEDEHSNGTVGPPISSLRGINAGSNISFHNNQSGGYCPIAAKGHKESVYALAMNDSGTLLVSGGTEKVIRGWDPRTGSKVLKLRGHTDNIRALLLDSTGRFCLSGSSDSMIRLWDLGQQRCVHSYAVHTDSVWALASNPAFTHVYSGGRDQSLYLTDLSTRESLLLYTKEEHPILQMALQDDSIWIATTASSVHRLPAEGRNPQKAFERGGSFLAGNLSFTRARASLEGSAPVPVYKEPSFTISGIPAIVKYEILNNRKHVLTKDTAGSVKLWEITKGVVIEDYGKVSFDEKKEQLFEMVSIPAWFAMDTRLGSLSVHLDTPQCFSAEMYATDLNLAGTPEDLKINLAQETLRGLLVHWMAKRRHKAGSHASSNGDVTSTNDIVKNHPHSKIEVDDGSNNNNFGIFPSFGFSTVSPPSIVTEGSHGGPWRKKITDLDGTEDEKDLPWWCMECVLNDRLPPRENTKCSFLLQACEGSSVQIITQGKLSAPRILRINKVMNYVLEKMVLDKPLEGGSSDGSSGLGSSTRQSQLSSIADVSLRSGMKTWQKTKPSIEILCNNQICVWPQRLRTMHLLGYKDIFTTNTSLTRVRAIPRYSFTFETIDGLNQMRPTIGIMPSGLPWLLDASKNTTFYTSRKSHQLEASPDLLQDMPHVRKLKHNAYCVPYSEHSCFSEIAEFIKVLQPSNISGIVSSTYIYINPRYYFSHVDRYLSDEPCESSKSDKSSGCKPNLKVRKEWKTKYVSRRSSVRVSRVSGLPRARRGAKIEESDSLSCS